MHILVARTPSGVRLVDLDGTGAVTATRDVPSAEWPAVAAARERSVPAPRWVWDDTA
ncbi:bifunctional 3'-5' exonuclease/DNA polymerase, partial [Clavibacter phaseoli]